MTVAYLGYSAAFIGSAVVTAVGLIVFKAAAAGKLEPCPAGVNPSQSSHVGCIRR
jgi:hypothetical protein